MWSGSMPPGDGIGEVCLLICTGAPVPAWLPEAVQRAVDYIAGIIEGATQYPTRKEITKRLADVRAAVELLRRETQWPVGTLMETAGKDIGVTWQDWSNVAAALDTLDRAADAVASGVREGRGRDRHVPDGDGLGEAAICATCVAAFWRETHGADAPHTSASAQAACAALWRAAGGADRSWGASPNGWRPHLQAAKQTDPARLAAIADMILGAQTRVRINRA